VVAAPAAPVVESPAPPVVAPPRHASTTPPASAPPLAERPERRAHSDSVSAAFDQAFASASSGPVDGVSTEQDMAEVRSVFNDVAAVHVSQVRDVMLELRYGDAAPAWIESTQPALRSLRAMASAMEISDLVSALDEFCVAVDAAVTGRARIEDAGKTELLRKYQRLIELIPQAFELDAERDRREPIIVEALLYQIPGVERRTVEKLFSVGLHRLDALMRASADEIEVVAGVRQDLAEAIVDQFRTYKKGASSALAAPDPLAERRQLGDLLIMLSVANDEFVHASSKWTEDARVRKQEARKQREQTFQRIKVALARLGERDQLARLEKLPYEERISTLDRYLSAAVPARSHAGKS
jgi:chemotaxis protein histidine kinase CheA